MVTNALLAAIGDVDPHGGQPFLGNNENVTGPSQSGPQEPGMDQRREIEIKKISDQDGATIVLDENLKGR